MRTAILKWLLAHTQRVASSSSAAPACEGSTQRACVAPGTRAEDPRGLAITFRDTSVEPRDLAITFRNGSFQRGRLLVAGSRESLEFLPLRGQEPNLTLVLCLQRTEPGFHLLQGRLTMNGSCPQRLDLSRGTLQSRVELHPNAQLDWQIGQRRDPLQK